MADLSGVLRKTIDGLPRATPQMRAKVYDKARAAIHRQVTSANPPLADEVVEARLAAIEDAIERTERHYQAADAGSQDGAAGVAAEAAARTDPSPPPPVPPRPAAKAPEGRRDPPMQAPAAGPEALPTRDPQAPDANGRPRGPEQSARPSADAVSPVAGQPRSRAPARPTEADEGSVFPGFRPSGETEPSTRPAGRRDPAEQPFFPLAEEDPAQDTAPASVGAPFVVPAGSRPAERRDERRQAERGEPAGEWDDEPLPAGLRSGDDFIPEADVSAPRYVKPRRRRSDSRGGAGKAIAACLVVLALAGLGTMGWLYRDDIEALLVEPQGLDTIARNANTNPAGGTERDPAADGAASAPTDATQEAAASAENQPPVEVASVEPDASTRAFTQRLLADGTETDDGPAEPQPNAFDEGTNIAAASPVDEVAGAGDDTPTVNSEIGADPETVGGPPSAPSETPSQPANAEVAAIAPSGTQTPAVAQKAIFYQERTETAAGTQETGNVVWSVVNEAPVDGQPAEPAVRAVVEVPEEGLTMTMTIRRNADPTLPASHVIEILFNTSADFDGGGIANVQRLALKATEQARGEPLIGVAGKISDGFFIVALNNLDEATTNNLTLLRKEQWIDIPIGYATGRRALISIEKGIPGEEAFNEAIDAWNAKT